MNKEHVQRSAVKGGRLKYKVGVQLLIVFILTSITVAILSTIFQLYFDYESELQGIERSIQEVKAVHLEPITQSIWNFDQDMARSQVQALSKLDNITYIKLSTEGGDVISAGMTTAKEKLITHFPVEHLGRGDKVMEIGKVEIHTDLDSLHNSFFDKFLLILFANVVKIFFVAGVIFFILNKLLTVPLRGLSSFIQSVDYESNSSPEPPSSTPFLAWCDNELSHIVSEVVNMEKELRGTYGKLKQSNHMLEERVQARTIELEKAKNKALELSRIDSLTELYNRRAFFDYAERIHAQAERSNLPYSVAMVDIDFFKDINDKYGHAAGDEALKTVAQLIQHEHRKSDLSGRLGGEEFAILMPETSIEAAYEFVERLRKNIAKTKIGVLQEGEITVSIGLTQSEGAEADFGIILGQADTVLYQAKNTGRNRVKRYKRSLEAAKV